uniref:Lipoprotein n=2 Tax=Caenorhabditis tropicalis TaxID=1561998 RepID=A0A1I7UW77_9PELO
MGCNLKMFLLFILLNACAASPPSISYKVNTTVIIPTPPSVDYRRIVQIAPNKFEEQRYNVCNGANGSSCGFWYDDTKTVKKIPSGHTSYDKKKKALVIKNMRASDAGQYMIGNKKHLRNLTVQE